MRFGLDSLICSVYSSGFASVRVLLFRQVHVVPMLLSGLLPLIFEGVVCYLFCFEN